MRFLRMLTNALIAGALGAAFVGVLIFQLNPQLPVRPGVLGALALRLWLFYGINLALGFYALIVVGQLFSRETLSPGWLSLRLLAWSSTIVTAGAAALMWFNLRDYRMVTDEEAARRMAAGAAATAVCAVLLLIIATVHYSFGRRGSRVGGTLYALTIGAALCLPMVARGAGGEPAHGVAPPPAVPATPSGSSGRVVMVLLDGASLEFIRPVTAEGRLPQFARLLEEGAVMHLSTLRPTQPGPVWAAVATGMYPPRNGIRATERYRFGAGAHEITLLPDLCLAHALVSLGIVDAIAQDATAFRAPPIWRVLSEVGVSVGVAGVPLTHPALPVRGYVVSDRLHLAATGVLASNTVPLIFPTDLLGALPDEAFEFPAGRPRPVGQGASSRDLFYARIAALLDARFDPQVRMIRFEGIDVAGHHYLRYTMPGAFGDVSVAQRQQFGQVLEQQYAIIDTALGETMRGLSPGDLLLVVSGFGMEPQSPGKRLLGQLLREPDLSGTHERAPDGFLLAWGDAVARARPRVGAIVDIAPTVLYFLGLPVARDMDGVARSDIFTRAFTADRPVTFIPSYGR